jgi:hypothetical protein
MLQLTLFSWGYFGWGPAPHLFVEAADAVEADRGFGPLFFVDIRIRREVRAKGFLKDAFERTVGSSRHAWMESLGNRRVREGKPGIQIDQPEAASELLDLAVRQAEHQRRVLFFCSCEFPRLNRDGPCHRSVVADLVLKVARQRELSIQIQEWPGGEVGRDVRIVVPRDAFRRINRNTKRIHLGDPAPTATLAGIPWYSPAEIQPGDNDMPSRYVLVGPARYSKAGWWAPRLGEIDPGVDRDDLLRRIEQLRLDGGFAARSSMKDSTRTS